MALGPNAASEVRAAHIASIQTSVTTFVSWFKATQIGDGNLATIGAVPNSLLKNVRRTEILFGTGCLTADPTSHCHDPDHPWYPRFVFGLDHLVDLYIDEVRARALCALARCARSSFVLARCARSRAAPSGAPGRCLGWASAVSCEGLGRADMRKFVSLQIKSFLQDPPALQNENNTHFNFIWSAAP